ncbi:protein FAR-RED IMPAIRED RESPONSE 1-like [Triticum dicoccoides]|uniref:protein FAR-RED IMPAIRED RESPONSE 1-like n=1 Tax=Triticum dicoccoides TaxID=85692 RepID=UPI00189027B2|nr:protein FAR-RED IMPAIRED RESPONSE 1-like [Triticum dicoccoides]
MEPNLIFGEVVDKNRAFEDADEDAFIFEEIRDSSDDQQVEQIMMLQPKKGMTFDSEDAAVNFYKDYAKKEGFGVIRRTTRHGEDSKLVYFTLACNRQGKAQYSSKNSFKPNPSTRMQCPAKINFSRCEEKFCITSITLDHNHPISPSKARFLRCHKKLDLHAKRRLELNDQAGIRLNKIFGSLVMEAGGYGNLEFGEKECRNYLQETRRLKLGAGDAHAVYQYFLRMQSKDPDFFHLMDVDKDGRLRNVFWADARKVDAYRASHAVQVQAEDPTSKHEDTMLNKEKLVLSPIPVRSAGRPRSKRKISKVDQVIQKLRAKKRQVPTSTTEVQTHKGRKNYVSKSKSGLQSSKQTEGNIQYEGYGAGSTWFFLNEFQELQTDEHATPTHIISYIDILQGKKNAMDLLAANLKE